MQQLSATFRKLILLSSYDSMKNLEAVFILLKIECYWNYFLDSQNFFKIIYHKFNIPENVCDVYSSGIRQIIFSIIITLTINRSLVVTNIKKKNPI